MLPTNESCEFTEEAFISAIERELQKHTHSQHLTISRISQSKERGLGYDGVIDYVLPLYIQFKRSHLYRGSFTGKLATDRKTKLGDEHLFFAFGLHKDRHTKLFEQHNALYALSQNFPACYVAPLFHKSSQLKALKTGKCGQFGYPWRHERLYIHEGPVAVVTRARMFDMSISITPHKHIGAPDPSHHYTFDRKRRTFFHSTPEPIEPSGQTLSEFIRQATDRLDATDGTDMAMEAVRAALSLLGDQGLDVLSQHVSANIPEQVGEIGSSNDLIYELPNSLQLKILEDLFWKEFGITQLVVHGVAV